MKRIMTIGLLAMAMLQACDKSSNTSDEIYYQHVDKEYVVIRAVSELQNNDDEISIHIDSIISGLIDVEFISSGLKSFDLDNDGQSDIRFEIIDLNKFNPNGLPESFDSLAARVHPVSLQVLDNSTYSYPDALDAGSEIADDGHWTGNIGVLGTFLNTGQFQGMGEKYLGFRFPTPTNYRYGWIKLYCSQHNDTLRIMEYAFNQKDGNSIIAGQKE